MDLPPPLNHIFVDYENVQVLDLSVIGSKGVTFTLLVGCKTTKLEIKVVEQLLANAASVELVRLAESGTNALDFTLAYYLGRAVAADPAGFFHIISKDTGYDPMIRHLQGRHIRVRRHDSFSKLTFGAALKPSAPAVKEPVVAVVSAPNAPAIDDPLARIVAHLRKAKHRPKNRQKLLNDLTSTFGKQSTAVQVEKLISKLAAAGYIAIDAKAAVTYTLPMSAAL